MGSDDAVARALARVARVDTGALSPAPPELLTPEPVAAPDNATAVASGSVLTGAAAVAPTLEPRVDVSIPVLDPDAIASEVVFGDSPSPEPTDVRVLAVTGSTLSPPDDAMITMTSQRKRAKSAKHAAFGWRVGTQSTTSLTARKRRGSSEQSRMLFMQYRGGVQRNKLGVASVTVEARLNGEGAAEEPGVGGALKNDAVGVTGGNGDATGSEVPLTPGDELLAGLNAARVEMRQGAAPTYGTTLEEANIVADPDPEWTRPAEAPDISASLPIASVTEVRTEEQQELDSMLEGRASAFEAAPVSRGDGGDNSATAAADATAAVTAPLSGRPITPLTLEKAATAQYQLEIAEMRAQRMMLRELGKIERPKLEGASAIDVFLPCARPGAHLLEREIVWPSECLVAITAASTDWITVAPTEGSAVHAFAEDSESQAVRDRHKELAGELLAHDGSDSDELMLEYGTACRRAMTFREGLLALTVVIQGRETQLAAEALWQRHLMFSAIDDTKRAIQDLNALLQLTLPQPRAYRSKAAILFEAGSIADSIVNLDMYLAFCPVDAEALFTRGETHLVVRDLPAAYLDFERLCALEPTVELLIKCAEYHQNSNQVLKSIKEATRALNIDPANAHSYLVRARSHLKARHEQNAVRDLSQCIHLDPVNAFEAYCLRGKLLRTVKPKQALIDLSISLMLENGVSNMAAYLHRGILYFATSRFKVAIQDFEKVLDLDQARRVKTTGLPPSRMTVFAHCQLGLISMLQKKNLISAILHFGRAIQYDPTYQFGYLFRAEAYLRVYQTGPRGQDGPPQGLVMGIRDYSRVIRQCPQRAEYYIMRARLLLHLKENALARHDIKAAAAVQPGLGNSILVEAQLCSFMGDHKKSLRLLDAHIDQLTAMNLDVDVDSSICDVKLAGAQALYAQVLMNCDRHEEAIDSFEDALRLKQDVSNWWYLLGLCFTHVQEDGLAIESFTCAIEREPKNYRAFYERGACELRLHLSRGIRDINKALSINPRMWTAYLTRACYYSHLGRFNKAILNCNVAISLEPKSVRALVTRGCLKFHNNHFESAIVDLTAAVELNSACSLAYYNRAVVYQVLREGHLAVKDYSVVIELDDSPNYVVYLNRAILFFDQGDYANALEDFLVMANSPELSNNIFVIHAVATCKHKVGDLDGAIFDFDRALAEDCQFLEALVGRGNVNSDRPNGGKELGRRDYQRALMLDPSSVTAYVNLAYSLQSDGSLKDAWNVASAALRLSPEHPGALEARAMISLQKGSLQMALADMSQALESSKSAKLYSNRGAVHLFLKDMANAIDGERAILRVDGMLHISPRTSHGRAISPAPAPAALPSPCLLSFPPPI